MSLFTLKFRFLGYFLKVRICGHSFDGQSTLNSGFLCGLFSFFSLDLFTFSSDVKNDGSVPRSCLPSISRRKALVRCPTGDPTVWLMDLGVNGETKSSSSRSMVVV